MAARFSQLRELAAAATQLGGYRSADASWIAMQADGRVVAAGALAQVLERAPSSASGSPMDARSVRTSWYRTPIPA